MDSATRSGWNSDEGRKGLRVALAVAAGFTWAVSAGAIIPFLGPLFAAQFLLASDRPMPLGKVVGMLVLIMVTAVIMEWIVAIAGHRPPVIMLLLGGIYFFCFALLATGKGGPAGFLIMIVGIMVPLLGILNRDLGESILSILLKGVATGAILMWLAHAILPSRGLVESDAGPAIKPYRPMWRAFANAVILLLCVVICLTNDNFSTALVIPITVASLLNQLDVASSGRAAVGIMLVNFLGGLAACIAFSFLEARPSLLFLFLTMLIAGLILGGNAARPLPSAKVFAGALTIFLVVLGISVSPLPGTAGETFTTRIYYILLAIVFVLTLAPLLWPRGAPRPTESSPDERGVAGTA